MDKNNNSTIIGAIALQHAFGTQPRISRCLIDNIGSPEAVFSLSSKDLDAIFRSDALGCREKLSSHLLEDAAEEYEKLSQKGISFAYLYDDAYPSLLRECEDAPILLYIRGAGGAKDLFENGRRFISIVGTREMTPYGKRSCERIVEALAKCENKPTIVSGLAMGVDITAQTAALRAGLPTIGVIPVGIDDIYPKRHRSAAEKICASKGCGLITDYPPETIPIAANFVRRNRIIAGMSSATILIESGAKGGGLITARLASGYGREVFAVPGRIDDFRSIGCNAIIANKTAEAVCSPELLPLALDLAPMVTQNHRQTMEEALRSRFGESEAEQLITLCNLIRRSSEIDPDELCRRSGFEYPQVARCIGILESEGFISTDVFRRCSINAKFA